MMPLWFGGRADDRRLSIYLSPLAETDGGPIALTGNDGACICWPGMEEDTFAASLERYPFGRRQLARWGPKRARELFRQYALPILSEWPRGTRRGTFLLRLGDNVESLPVPAFAKSRPIDAPGAAILQRLNPDLHYGKLARVDRADRPFREKRRVLLWRGATTGNFLRADRPVGPRAFVGRWAQSANPAIDVGFHRVVEQLARRPRDLPAGFEAQMKPALSLAEQLSCRYLLSLEGNDVATGLKWQLYSRSVVLMPPPRMESWAAERLLVPYEHYVPVAPDLSDLEAVLAWCEDNEAACETIAMNGRRYMRPFANGWAERRRVREVTRRALGALTYVRAEGADIGLDLP